MSRTVAASTGFVNAQTIAPGSNQTTTSTTIVSTGQGVSISPSYTGRFLVILTVTASHSVADTGVSLDVFRNTTTIPTNGSAATGTDLGATQSPVSVISPTAGGQVTTTAVFLDTPGPGTALYNYYITYLAAAAGTATLVGGKTVLTVIEI